MVLSLMEAVSIVSALIYYHCTTFQLKLSLVDLDRSQPPLFIQVCRHLQAVLASPISSIYLPDVITLRSSNRGR